MRQHILTLRIAYEQDVVLARQRAAAIADGLGFDRQDISRIATAVSELARNAFRHAGGGRVRFAVDHHRLLIEVNDQGPGFGNPQTAQDGASDECHTRGRGLAGVKRIMDLFDLASSHDGTRVLVGKALSAEQTSPTPDLIQKLIRRLCRQQPQSPYEEIQRQNQELLAAMASLRQKQQELEQLNRELTDTNRGIIFLSRELEEKADHLQRINRLQAQFISHLSHEFRTPLNAILGLAQLLLDEADGELNPEQRKQLGYIHLASKNLTDLVNDLLDLARLEAGKMTLRVAPCSAGQLLSSLRGMLKPTLGDKQRQVVLAVEDVDDDFPLLETDENKLAQILRNLVSNALKFTERGEVRVRADYDTQRDQVRFQVTDTGIGIAPEDQERIFEEYTQIDHRLQGRVKGTGLGLPLSRKLAHALGGDLTVESVPGRGSCFTLQIPRRLQLSDREAQ
ncbi:ATP-binding protein [Geothermobacter hydrogeniphilus]|uniref:histidine kinase n=1 Tax=Geothermobacter hydrogeniphilus TaxID=1969733 RepID=A0A1X0YCQ2_9BACT|nr:ATP-binding protein [Geothermobacter hydrogeniphilus]ORJ63000.1 hypothetical protein B5V00_02820 [Geothermobacter hydrogeniphilus]